MAALALGSSPLTGLGSLRPGIRLWLAIIAGVLGLLGVATVVSFAVRVLIGRTLIISDVVNKSKYAKHRKEIYRRIGYRFPRQEAAEADRWNIFDDAFLLKCEHQQRSGSENERREGRDGLNVVMLILENAALIETQKRFDELCLTLAVIFPLLILFIGTFAWAANPGKEITKEFEKPVEQNLALNNSDKTLLGRAGIAPSCLS